MNYTSIEQSKKLLALGLKAETADACYDVGYGQTKAHIECENFIDYFTNDEFPELKDRYIPCWSVGALIDLLPGWINIMVRDNNNHSYYTDSFIRMSNISVSYKHFDKTQEMYIPDIEFVTSSNFMECLYNMIVWLLENNYIKNELIEN